MTKMTIDEMIKKYYITIVVQDGQEMMRVGYNKKPTTTEVVMFKTMKSEIIAEIKRREAEKAAELQAYKEKIRINVPGLEELKSIRDEWENFYDKRSASIENGGINYPKEPATKVKEISEKYPIAAAYIKAKSYTNASDLDKYSAGKKAVEAIKNGEDYIKVLETMENEWSKAAHESVWNN